MASLKTNLDFTSWKQADGSQGGTLITDFTTINFNSFFYGQNTVLSANATHANILMVGLVRYFLTNLEYDKPSGFYRYKCIQLGAGIFSGIHAESLDSIADYLINDNINALPVKVYSGFNNLVTKYYVILDIEPDSFIMTGWECATQAEADAIYDLIVNTGVVTFDLITPPTVTSETYDNFINVYANAYCSKHGACDRIDGLGFYPLQFGDNQIKIHAFCNECVAEKEETLNIRRKRMEIVRKHQIALFLEGETSGSWVRMAKGTELTLAMNPNVETFDFIADEMPTDILRNYKISIAQVLKAYKGSPDYDLLYGLFYNTLVGEEAKRKVLVAFMTEPGTGAGSFKAWQSEATVSITENNAVESTLNFDILFNGGVTLGTVAMSGGEPTFTEDTTP